MVNNKKVKKPKKIMTGTNQNMTISEYKKFRKTEEFTEEIRQLKQLLIISSTNNCLSVPILNTEIIDKQIKQFNQFILAEAIGQLRQDRLKTKN